MRARFHISLFMQRYSAPANHAPLHTKMKTLTVVTMGGSSTTGGGQEGKKSLWIVPSAACWLLQQNHRRPAAAAPGHQHPTAHTNVYVKIP